MGLPPTNLATVPLTKVQNYIWLLQIPVSSTSLRAISEEDARLDVCNLVYT